jgi:hypothetical protein
MTDHIGRGSYHGMVLRATLQALITSVIYEVTAS